MKFVFLLLAVLVFVHLDLGSASDLSIRERIAAVAKGYEGSEKWSFKSWRKVGRNKWKCNIFVAEVIEEAGAVVPHRRWWKWTPIGAEEWGKADSEYLADTGCWETTTSPGIGDVATDGKHVAIVTGDEETVSATYDKVVRNDWGFDPPKREADLFWRYTCDD
ncbi:hypothetical protein CAPTEDRAFT_202383 [Capitella teleta]|uniref:Peptidase C51 domain-containing protein n=1 Tax=Capitella teleta TaxID=283909 RepID=R7TCN5_CAPTE|nr:hypothetical protein CAPTEDRAFT_202383 [Capitella teleta]|eukprot:ELT91267.1 hypothetical protein CAPTEDRAFT_202383 [Capitella teleta]